MTNETHQRLLDVQVSCQAIGQYTAGLDFAAYERDAMVRDAVERRLGIVGEALSRVATLEPSLADRIPDLRQIVGLRNRVIHGYDAVDDEIVWDVVQHWLPRLQAHVAELLEEVEPRETG
jgi:uncharacterized protein with HEPN domain